MLNKHAAYNLAQVDFPAIDLRRLKSMENSVTPKNFCYSIQEKRNTRGLYVTDFEVVGPKRSKCMQFVKEMAFWT